MNMHNELKKKYTTTELILLVISLFGIVISALFLDSKDRLALASIVCGLLVVAVITVSKSRAEHQSEVRFGIKFDGFGGLNINGLVVSEFGYLIRYITNGRIDRLNDFKTIHENRQLILDAITQELSQQVMKEEEAFGVSRTTAESNMRNLESIVLAISNYYAETSPGNTKKNA